MKRLLIPGAMTALLFTSLSAIAQTAEKPEWNNEYVSEVNREKACQIAIPFADEQQATKLAIEESPYYKTLNGIWKFHWVADPKDRPQDFYLPNYDVTQWDNIKVPATWQIEAVRHNKNWDKPLYCNTIYPFCPWNKVQWPNVIQPRPSDYTFATMPNPVGSYRRDFTLPDSWKGRDVFIRFNGVEAGFYIWVNGKKVGYSEDSYLPAEFNLTPYLKPGKNVLAVEVYRFTDGSYLECQDFWRFSGIFRDVFLWSAPKTQIRDFFFRTDLDKEYKNASVSLDIDITGKRSNNEIQVKVTDQNGKEIATQNARAVTGTNKLQFEVVNPLKWTAETPNLYNLTILLKQKGKTVDIRSVKVGFRKIELAQDGRLLINGKSTLFKGVDRHDHSSENGRTVSKEEMEKDVQLMKSLNINAVRTSHYPNNPYFYDLCDRYGIYVLSEANVECHGLMALSSEPSWVKAFTERSENMVRRYKNHASIVMWSLGNESGNGINFKSAAEAVKKLDDTRPTHYEGNSSYCDVTSSMYPDVQWLESVGKERLQKFQNGETVKPHVVCEYAHAMGNAIGNLEEYWDYIEHHSKRMIGGCIWDWVDQGINMPGQPADHYYFGGSFGDRPNDNDFCCNGIVTADRQVTPKLWEVKKVYQYITLEPNAENSIGVRNRYAFLNLHDFNLRYVILKDGVPIAEEEFSLPDGKPGEHRAVQIPYSRYLTSEGEYYLNLEIKLKKDCVWAKAGHIVATEQLLLQKSPNTGLQPVAVSASSKESLFKVVEEEKRYLFFRRPGVEITFDKKEGKLTGIRYNGDNMLHLREGWSLNTFRFINNDVRKWQDTQTEVISFDWKWSEDNQSAIVTIQLQETVGDVKVPYKLIYRLYGNGEIDVDASFTTNDDFNLPRLSLQAFFNPSLEQLEWYGRGPIENYRDRKNAAYVGKYQSAVNDMKESYARSQTMGGRCDTRWLTLTNKAGKGIKITAADTFDFSALHYTDKDLFEIKYGHALPDIYRAEVVLNLDCIQRGLGNASCGPGPRPAYEIQKNTVYKYAFRMSPFSK